MSGFVAVVGRHANTEFATHLRKMSQEINYRGDLESVETFSDRCAAATRSRSDAGYTTSTYSDGQFAIVLDGLIFNQGELAHAIGTEPSIGNEPSIDIARIVLEGFRKYGDDWFVRLDGSFALMISDLRSGEAILARDRFAHRPMYFGHSDGNTWVATEAKAILDAPGYRRELNKDNLHSAIGYGFTPGPQTLYKGIFKCVPGFIVRIDSNGKQHNTDYFTPSIDLKPELTIEDGKRFVLAAVKKNVGHYLDECPDLALMLSGGVDSALLAHLTTELSGGKTSAVSFGAESWSSDESGEAGDLAGRLGMKFSRTFVSPDDDLLGSLRRVIHVLEEPTRFENAMALEMTTRDAADDCTAFMTGEGADFILGEREHAVAGRIEKVLKLPGFLRAMGRSLPLAKMPSSQLRALAPYFDWKSIRDYGQKCSANCCDLVPGAISPPGNDIVGMLANVTSDWPIQSQYTFMTLREAAHCWIERMEKLSAAVGLECFHPFESNDIFQFGLEMPDHLRNADGVNKPVVRGLAADIFDRKVAYGEKKQLAAPMPLWLNESEQLREAVLNLRRPDSRIREFLDHSVMDKHLEIYAREGASSEPVAVHLFRMLTFEIWLDMFI